MKPKLTLRDLFWLVVVVAVACGWWIENQSARRQRKQIDNAARQLSDAHKQLREAGWIIHGEPDLDYDWHFMYRRN